MRTEQQIIDELHALDDATSDYDRGVRDALRWVAEWEDTSPALGIEDEKIESEGE